jgi:hypothetical protein
MRVNKKQNKIQEVSKMKIMPINPTQLSAQAVSKDALHTPSLAQIQTTKGQAGNIPSVVSISKAIRGSKFNVFA